MRGGDKALVPRKAEAKAGRYTPFFKNVDESSSGAARCLTALRKKRAAGGRCLVAGPRKIRSSV
jgi:hypothetical protein